MRPRGRTLVISLLALCAAVAAVAGGADVRAEDRPDPAPQRRVSPQGRDLLIRWGEALHLPQWTPAATLAATVVGSRHPMFGRGSFVADLEWARQGGLSVEARVPWALAPGMPPETAAAARRGFSEWTRQLLVPVLESPLRRAADYHVEVASEDGTPVVLLTAWAPTAEFESVRLHFLAGSGLCERSVAVRRVDPSDPAAQPTAGAEITTSYLYRASGARSLLTETRTLTPAGETVVQYGYDDEETAGALAPARASAPAGATPRLAKVTVISAANSRPIELAVGGWRDDGEPATADIDEWLEKLLDKRRSAPWIRGRVTLPDGTPAARAAIRVLAPVSAPAPGASAAPRDDLDLIAHVIYFDPRDWGRPQPLAAWNANLAQATASPRPGREVATDVADADGRFRIRLPGDATGESLVVTARAAKGTATVVDARGGEDLDIVIGAVMRAAGRLRDHDGAPVAKATVILSTGTTERRATTDDDGTFGFDDLAPGRYVLRAGADGYAPLLRKSVLVRADREIDVRLPRGTTLAVTAIIEAADDDEALAGVDVVVMETDSFVYVRGRTGADGTCTFEGLPPGTYTVNGRSTVAASFGEEMAELDGTAPEHAVELYFEPFVETTVTVVDDAGRPVEGMAFHCANADEEFDAKLSRRLPGATDAAGRFTFAFEFDGPHSLIYGQREGFGLLRVIPAAHDSGKPFTVRAGRAMRIFGTVRRPDGRPWPGARVIVEAKALTASEADRGPEEEDEDLLINLLCGPDGTFEYAFTPRGEVWITAEFGDDAWSDDYSVVPVPGQDDYRVDIELEDWR